MVLRHYRFNIKFSENPDSLYVIQDMYGYLEYNTISKKVTKMCNGAVRHNNSVTQQLFSSPKTIGSVTSDNLLSASTTDVNFITNPINSSVNNSYTGISTPPPFYFGKLILAAAFITIYYADNTGNNIAQSWELTSSQNGQISLSFTQGTGDTWTPVDDSIATYNIEFTQVSADNPTAPACFIEGSKISSHINNEDTYIPIENLRKGDLVKTYLHGYRKIKMIGKNTMINDSTRWNYCIKRLSKNTLGASEDLMVTGGHSILVDTLSDKEREGQIAVYNNADRKIDGKYLLLASASDNFETVNDNNTYTYYHFVLEHDNDVNVRYGVWANDILTESQPEKHFLEKNYD